MKIGLAQIRPIPGEVMHNLALHQSFIARAIAQDVDLILFPELSLTGYEPTLAQSLATTLEDKRFDVLQRMSDRHAISIAVGMPTRHRATPEDKPLISLILFQPQSARQVYSKQILHEDELPYFSCGKDNQLWAIAQYPIAPAICYESLQIDHATQAFQQGAQLYLVSVAKSENGIEKAKQHYSRIAATYSMAVCMVNSVGHCNEFEAAGQSAVWNKQGTCLGQLGASTEGLLIYHLETGAIEIAEGSPD